MVLYIAKRTFKVDQDRLDLTGIIAYLQNMIRQVGLRLDKTSVNLAVYRRRVRISKFRCKFVLACFKKHSLLRLLNINTKMVNLNPTEPKRSNAIKQQEPLFVL